MARVQFPVNSLAWKETNLSLREIFYPLIKWLPKVSGMNLKINFQWSWITIISRYLAHQLEKGQLSWASQYSLGSLHTSYMYTKYWYSSKYKPRFESLPDWAVIYIRPRNVHIEYHWFQAGCALKNQNIARLMKPSLPIFYEDLLPGAAASQLEKLSWKQISFGFGNEPSHSFPFDAHRAAFSDFFSSSLRFELFSCFQCDCCCLWGVCYVKEFNMLWQHFSLGTIKNT